MTQSSIVKITKTRKVLRLAMVFDAPNLTLQQVKGRVHGIPSLKSALGRDSNHGIPQGWNRIVYGLGFDVVTGGGPIRCNFM